MSSWLDTVLGDVHRPGVAEAHQRGQRSAIDLADVGPAPPQRLHDAPLMGLRDFATTVIVRMRSMSGDADDEQHMLARSQGPSRHSDAGTAVSDYDESKSADADGTQSRASRMSMVSKVSFHESKELASLASKYSMLSAVATPAAAEATTAVKKMLSEARYAELVKEREEAVLQIRALVHGLSDERPFWDHNFCYLKFHTAREARYAVRSIHHAILKGEGLNSAVINAYLI